MQAACIPIFTTCALDFAPCAPSQQGKFKVGQQVEVLRSDNTWSLASVKEYDWRACNYTVMLPDMRLKYMVEEEDLRQPVLGYSARND